MGRRGRPPFPDILTPREWEVLALLREGLTNEAIADRLGVTYAAAKCHVSEILSKLGVATREEAAAWQPEAAREADAPSGPQLRRWWAGAAGWLRPVTVGKAALIAAAVAVLAGLGVLAWGVVRESGVELAAVVAARRPHSPVVKYVPMTLAGCGVAGRLGAVEALLGVAPGGMRQVGTRRRGSGTPGMAGEGAERARAPTGGGGRRGPPPRRILRCLRMRRPEPPRQVGNRPPGGGER